MFGFKMFTSKQTVVYISDSWHEAKYVGKMENVYIICYTIV